MTDPSPAPLATPLRGLAIGRLVLGTLGLAVPGPLVRAFGLRTSPELDYMTRIFGARAIALGLGYLTSSPDERSRWQRLALLVDASDTITGAGHLKRRDVPVGAALALIALTGGYFAVGASRLAADLRGR